MLTKTYGAKDSELTTSVFQKHKEVFLIQTLQIHV